MKRTVPTKFDSTGWHAAQFCAPVPPVRPATNDFREFLAEKAQTPVDNTPPGPQPQKKHLTPFGWC